MEREKENLTTPPTIKQRNVHADVLFVLHSISVVRFIMHHGVG